MSSVTMETRQMKGDGDGRSFHFFPIFRLAVPVVKIHGDREMYVERGSSVSLRCVISNWLQRPNVVFWLRDGVRLVRTARQSLPVFTDCTYTADCWTGTAG